ncbi:hypothetical protein [Halocola ammonii]
MKDLNGYILGLKLKRYQIRTDSVKDESYFEIGGTNITTQDYILKGYVPLGIGIAILILIFATMMDANKFLRRVAFFVPVIIGGYGIAQLLHFKRQKASNKRLIAFEKGKLRIYDSTDDQEITFTADQIKGFEYSIEKDKKDELQYLGIFSFRDDKDNQHTLLEVFEDENKKYLEDDFKYAKSYLEQLVFGKVVEEKVVEK